MPHIKISCDGIIRECYKHLTQYNTLDCFTNPLKTNCHSEMQQELEILVGEDVKVWTSPSLGATTTYPS